MTPGTRYTNRKTGRTVTLIEPCKGGFYHGEQPGWRARYDEGNTTRLLERTIKRSWLPEGDPRLATGLDTAEIEARLAAATEGPWAADLDIFDCEECEIEACVSNMGTTILFTSGTDQNTRGSDSEREAAWIAADKSQELKDAAFIAHARTDIPALLAEIDRLSALVKGRGK